MSDPRPDLLAKLPALIAARISAALPELRECAGMVGGFDVEELKRQGLRAPAIRVSRLGVQPMQALAGPHDRFAVAMAAFVVTRDQMGLPRDEAMSNIVAALLQMVPENCWGESGVGPAQQIEERVLVGREARAITAALSAVTWRQPVTLAPRPEGTVMPVEFYATGLGEDAQ